MSAKNAIRERVEGFVRDFASWNAKFYQPGDSGKLLDWKAARHDFEMVAARHFVSNENVSGVGLVIGWPPEHSPEQETIVSIVEHSDEQAVVETELRQSLKSYYEYSMRRVGDEWRIASVQMLLSSKSDVVNDLDLRTLGRGLHEPVLMNEFPAGLEQLFGRSVRLQTRHGVANTEVTLAGTIEAPSGFLTGDDPGNWQSGVAVFDKRIPPGRHEIELVTDDQLKIVGAARVVFDRHKKGNSFAYATRGEAAGHDTANSHVIAVDGGIIGLADAGAIISLSRRDRERLYTQIAGASLRKGTQGAAFIALSSSLQVCAIDSGCGDGGYAAYWHLDEKGQPISLIFDFVDLAMPIWDTLRLPFEIEKWDGVIEGATPKSRNVSVRLGCEGNQRFLSVNSDKETKTKLFDLNGRVTFDSEDFGCSVCGNETTYFLPESFPKSLAGELEVQVYLGHGYEIIKS